MKQYLQKKNNFSNLTLALCLHAVNGALWCVILCVLFQNKANLCYSMLDFIVSLLQSCSNTAEIFQFNFESKIQWNSFVSIAFACIRKRITSSSYTHLAMWLQAVMRVRICLRDPTSTVVLMLAHAHTRTHDVRPR